MSKSVYTIAVIGFFLSFVGAVNAGEKRFYAGFSAGYSQGEVDAFSETALVAVANQNGLNLSVNGNDLRSIEDELSSNDPEFSWRAYLGYHVNDYIDAEVMYLDLGSFERTANRTSSATVTVPLLGTFRGSDCVSEQFATTAYGIALLAHTPETRSGLSLFAKAGVSHWEAAVDTRAGTANAGLFSGSGVTGCNQAPVSSTRAGQDAFLGAGVRHKLGNWGLRVELERFNGIKFSPAGEAALYLLSAGIEYRF